MGPTNGRRRRRRNVEAEGEEQTISSRLETAATTWGTLWAGGEAYTIEEELRWRPYPGNRPTAPCVDRVQAKPGALMVGRQRNWHCCRVHIWMHWATWWESGRAENDGRTVCDK